MVWIFLTAVLVFFVFHRTFRHVLYGLAAFASVALVVGVIMYTHATRQPPGTTASVSSGSQAQGVPTPAPPTNRIDELVQAVGAPPQTPAGEDPYASEARARIARLRQLQQQETIEERWQRLMRQSRQP